MKIIFSRKGFDTTNGGFPSPVFPDRTCYSLPIPGKYNDKTYADLEFKYNGDTIQKICNNLTNFKIKINGKIKDCDYFDGKFHCHQDPCQIDNFMILGQKGGALGHLKKQNVKEGDIFLFYGLFQKVKKVEENWRYIENPFHLIYAMLKIDKVVYLENNKDEILKENPFLGLHPHIDEKFLEKYPKNGFYIGKEFQIFKFSENRILTDMDEYKGKSFWKLPINFDFSKYISFIKQVKLINRQAYLSYRGIGQEFVLNTEKMRKEEKIEIQKFLNYLQ